MSNAVTPGSGYRFVLPWRRGPGRRLRDAGCLTRDAGRETRRGSAGTRERGDAGTAAGRAARTALNP